MRKFLSLNTNLDYANLGLKYCGEFELNINSKQYTASQWNVVLKSKVTTYELMSLFFECDSPINNNSKNANNYDHEICMTPQSSQIAIPNSMGQNFYDYNYEKMYLIQNGVL